MATIQRPVKTYGNRNYVAEVASAPSNYDPILANEVDGDLDTIYAAWNGGVDTTSIKDYAVTTPKLADAPLGVATGKINDLAVTTGKLNDNAVTLAKLLPGVCISHFVSVSASPSTTIGTTEFQIFSLPSLTVRGGALLFAPTSASMEMGPNVDGVLVCTWKRDGVTTYSHYVRGQNTGAARLNVPLPMFFWFDAPGAGPHVYSMNVVANVTDLFYKTNTAPGICFGIALA